MKPMSRKFKKEDSLLRKEHESTLEKNQAKRIARRELINREMNKIVKDRF
jgi:hypothetical protein